MLRTTNEHARVIQCRSCGKKKRVVPLINTSVSKTELYLITKIEKTYNIVLHHPFQLESKFYDAKYKNILIESDGSYWHAKPKGIKADIHKNLLASKYGYILLRFTLNRTNDVDKKWNEIKAVLDPLLA